VPFASARGRAVEYRANPQVLVSRSHNPISISPLEKGGEAEWAAFLETASGSTLFHDMRFLAYHPQGRHHFAHLLARRDGELIAVIPGGLIGSAERPIFTSPLGGSVGGPAVAPDLKTEGHLDLVAALKQYVVSRNWTGIEMVLPPAIYRSTPSDMLQFALSFHGFRMVNRWLCQVVPIEGEADGRYRALFRATHANRVRAGLRMNIHAVQGGRDLLEPFLAVFDDTYRRHGAKPTHDAGEIADLLRRLPDRVQIHMAFLGDVPVAGVLVFLVNSHVAYTFYICRSTAHARVPGSAVAFASLIDSLGASGHRWLDLGPSARLANFNHGVTLFKEGLGGIGYCRDRWCWSTEDSPAVKPGGA
jgi:hypothetical protein